MIDYQRLFHTGIRVPDLDAAMADMGSTMGLTWAEPRINDAQTVWTPERGRQEVHLRFVYSCEGPQHVELLEGEVGSIWDGRQAPGVHHIGIWVTDLAAATERCLADGWRLAAAQAAPDDGYGVFTYLAPPSGTVVELVDEAIEPGMAAWWAAGPSTD